LPKNDEGEFELILGNRQLISVFVIVVVLLGVFFSMGYIVGRNSAPAETARVEKPATDSSPSPAADTSTSSPPAADTSATDAPVETPPSITQPEKPAAPPPAPKTEAKRDRRKPSPASEASVPAPARVSSQVASGQYWQVVATARPDAEIIAEALGKKGFHAILSPAPKDGVFRVLVGPFADAPSQAQARTNLEAAGFKNPILRKY
jgi:cell division septation protein DedD